MKFLITLILSTQLFASDIEKHADALAKSHPRITTGNEFEFAETKRRIKADLEYIFANYLTTEGHTEFEYYEPGSVGSFAILSKVSRTVGGESAIASNGSGDYFFSDRNAVYTFKLGTCFDASDLGSYRYYYFVVNQDDDYQNPNRKRVIFLNSNGSKVSQACETRYFKNL